MNWFLKTYLYMLTVFIGFMTASLFIDVTDMGFVGAVLLLNCIFTVVLFPVVLIYAGWLRSR